MSSLLVLGGRGQLGSDIVRLAAERRIPCVALGRDDCDATSREALVDRVKASGATHVVNCVAYTNVDRAEDEPAQAFAANAIAARNAAEAAKAAGARLMHVSTSYVFDGARCAPYEEGDVPSPLGVYSASKLAGENLVRTAMPEATIVRLVSIYGHSGARAKESGNFVEAFVRRIQAGQDLRVIADQTISPSFTSDLAGAMLDLAAREQLPPVVHLANSGSCSWYELARRIHERLGGKSEVSPIASSQWPFKSPRPPNAAMSTRLFASLTGQHLPPWEDALDRYLKEKGYA